MQHLNVPVLATRVGSLAERIAEGDTGWLIEANAASLVEKIHFLFDHREEIEAVRNRLCDSQLPGTGQMVQRYETLCLPRPVRQKPVAISDDNWPDTSWLQATSRAFQLTGLAAQSRQLGDQVVKLQQEVEKRTAWAEERERARKEEQKQKIKWVNDLQDRLQQEQDAHEQTRVLLAQLRSEHEQVLASSSWRITRPLRAGRRMLHNFMQARAWNPLRWPLLLSQLVRTLKTQGLRGTATRPPAGFGQS
jgi:hypothetical protein